MAGDISEQNNVMAEVFAERNRQDEKWGGPEHDDQHMANDWVGFVEEHNARAGLAARIGGGRDNWRQQMIRVAALAIAAVESYDRRTQR